MNKLIKHSQYKTTNWAGGSTTEMFVYPEHSSYDDRNFWLRISSATINQSPSVFTKLEGYKRIITILNGEVALHHNNIKSKELKPCEVHLFMGDWETYSDGLAKDFNVIYSDKISASLEVKMNSNNEWLELSPDNQLFYFLFVYKGEIRVNETSLCAKDSMVILDPTKIYLTNESILFCVTIKLI